MKFEEKLSKLRKQNALSQEELAEKLNVSRQTISKWELGQTKPDSGKIQEIASLFNVSTDELLDETTGITQPQNQSNGKGEHKTMNTIIIIILVVGLIIAVGYIGFFLFVGNTAKEIIGTGMNRNQEGMNLAKDIIGTGMNLTGQAMNRSQEGMNVAQGVMGQATNIIGGAQETIQNSNNEMKKREEDFNTGYNQTLQTMEEMKENREEQQNEQKARQEEMQKQFEENQKRVQEGYNETLRQQEEFRAAHPDLY